MNCICMFSFPSAIQVSLQMWAEGSSTRQSMRGPHIFPKKNQLDETASIIQHCTRPLNKSLAAAGHRRDKLSLGRVSLHGL